MTERERWRESNNERGSVCATTISYALSTQYINLILGEV